jgi:serine/threonine protein kinase
MISEAEHDEIWWKEWGSEASAWSFGYKNVFIKVRYSEISSHGKEHDLFRYGRDDYIISYPPPHVSSKNNLIKEINLLRHLNSLNIQGVPVVRNDLTVIDGVTKVITENGNCDVQFCRLATEKVIGTSLAELFKEHSHESHAACTFAICNAAETLLEISECSEGVESHGDLKPGAIILTADGITILDWGSARFGSPLDINIKATLGYTSPWRLMNSWETDVVSLAKIASEDIIGSFCFHEICDFIYQNLTVLEWEKSQDIQNRVIISVLRMLNGETNVVVDDDCRDHVDFWLKENSLTEIPDSRLLNLLIDVLERDCHAEGASFHPEANVRRMELSEFVQRMREITSDFPL